MTQTDFPQTDRNRVRRSPARGVYDKAAVHRILDASLIGHVGFAARAENSDVAEQASSPCVIPMLLVRHGDDLLFHGARTSRLIQVLSSGAEICVSVAIVDGLVLAKSIFHHSLNYRSVVVYGRGREVTDTREVEAAFKAISDKTMRGRWEDARKPSAKEKKSTTVVAVNIESASAKVRSGDPVDDPEDQSLPVWSGVIPVATHAGNAVADRHTSEARLQLPEYVNEYLEQAGH
ncbi:MAG TPA: pyridoxamine 5'-phosphate oxidase family protein [Planctomycetaceae bacterium]|nr:pyridoxamine 5'-phosphate oxidase family protein [Planctomycetaceae bacterium]